MRERERVREREWEGVRGRGCEGVGVSELRVGGDEGGSGGEREWESKYMKVKPVMNK